MKTAREKAMEFVGKNRHAPWGTIMLRVERLLNEQDRDTRHACAEAVGEAHILRDCDIGRVESIIMNTKAV